MLWRMLWRVLRRSLTGGVIVLAAVCALAMLDAVVLAEGSVYFTRTVWTREAGFVYEGQTWTTGDFNGDGKTDLATYFNSEGSWYCEVYVSTGLGFIRQTWARQQGDMSPEQQWFTGDFNGDGKTDFAKFFEYPEGQWTCDVHLSTGTSFVMERWATGLGEMGAGRTWVTGDFNGDRKTEFATYWNNEGWWTCDVYALAAVTDPLVTSLQGQRSFAKANWATQQGQMWPEQRWFTSDFNGDGKTDFAKFFDDGNSTWDCDVHVSDGSAFTLERWADRQGGLWAAQQWWTGDFDGNGKCDFAKFFTVTEDGSDTWDCDVHLVAESLSTLQGREYRFAMDRWATRQGNVWPTQRWFTGDFDGNGKTDFAKVFDQDGWTCDVHLSTGMAFVMQRAATGLGEYVGGQLLTGDFDGNGTTDFVSIYESPPSVVRFWGLEVFLSVVRVGDICLRLQAIRVTDDDGARPALLTAEEFSEWVAFANLTYASAGISFFYDPATDFAEIRSTVLNNMSGDTDSNWVEEVTLGNDVAARYPGKVVVFVVGSTGGGFSSCQYNFVRLFGFEGSESCTQRQLQLLAHELGHHLGLGHTHKPEFRDEAAAAQYLEDHGSNPSVFDGDGLSDTLLDPFIPYFGCAAAKTELILKTKAVPYGVVFPLPRDNIMSYYHEASVLSPMQASIARWTASVLLRGHCTLPTNVATGHTPAETVRLEAENLSCLSSLGTPFSEAPEKEWLFCPSWSNDRHLRWSGGDGESLTLRFRVDQTKDYHLSLYATLEDGFGIFRAQIDGKDVGAITDTYAPFVLPSGQLELSKAFNLTQGEHTLKLTIVGKNNAATGYGLGIDCLELGPVGSQSSP